MSWIGLLLEEEQGKLKDMLNLAEPFYHSDFNFDSPSFSRRLRCLFVVSEGRRVRERIEVFSV